MATEAEIQQSLVILAGARLRNSPSKDEAPLVKATWLRTMKDIPGEILLTAIDEVVINSEFWPTPAEMRRKAAQVKIHNGKGASTPFDAAYVRPMNERRSGSIVTPDGWFELQPAHRTRESFHLPAAYWREHDRLKAKYADGSGLPTDDELYALEMLRGIS